MGYVIVGILSFIVGYIVCQIINREKKETYIMDNEKIVKEVIENTHKEMEKIKEELGKEVKEKDRDEIIKDIDDYFEFYGYPTDGNSR